MNPSEMWIPIVMFGGLAVVLSLFVWFRYKAKRELQLTIRAAIEKEHGLTPEMIDNLMNPPIPPHRDLRRGLIGVLTAVGFALFGLILGEEDAVRPMLGVAMFPLSIGIAFLLMHRFGRSSTITDR